MKTDIHFTWRPIYILHEDRYTFNMKTDIHFTWRPIYILHEDRYTFWSYRAHFFLECVTQNLQRKSKHFMFNNSPPENRAVYEITWKNTVQPDRPQMTIWRTRIACWIPKATDVHWGYVILLLFHCNSGCTNAPQYNVIRTLAVLFCVWIASGEQFAVRISPVGL